MPKKFNCQKINVSEDSFENCDYISSSFNIVSNNAQNRYGTCCLISSNFITENIKTDTNGRIISFSMENMTFCNVYLHSGN